MSAKLRTVHVRVNDAATGQPTAVRIRFIGPDGTYYAPLGRLADFILDEHLAVGGNVRLGLQGREYAYIDGTCEVRLPPASIALEIHKGPEFTPRYLDAALGVGQVTLRLQIQRWVNLRQDGWYSGDIRAHALTPHAALLEAAAEDLAVVNLLAEQTRLRSFFEVVHLLAQKNLGLRDVREHPAILNILAFSGQRPALEAPDHLVVVNTYNRDSLLGSLALLNCHRPVFPLLLDDLETWPDWTLADCADQCHRKNGLVVWANMPGNRSLDDEVGPEDAEDWIYGEPLADLLVGKVDAVELRAEYPFEVHPEKHWYRFLNCGYRVPLVGGSAKRSNGQLLGGRRTYARLQPGEGFTYQGWIEAIRAGRTFVTNGPLLSLTVNGQDPGAVLDLPSRDEPVRLLAQARSTVPIDHLEIVLNGEVLARAEASGSPASASLELETRLPASGWLAARCSGSTRLPALRWAPLVAAHTSPVYVQVGGQLPPSDKAAAAYLLGDLDRLLNWLAAGARSANGQPPQRLGDVCRRARAALAQRAGM